MWGKQLKLTNGSHRLPLKVEIYVDGNEIVFVKNNVEERIPVEPERLAQPTTIEFLWRTRMSHFRFAELKARTKMPLPQGHRWGRPPW